MIDVILAIIGTLIEVCSDSVLSPVIARLVKLNLGSLHAFDVEAVLAAAEEALPICAILRLKLAHLAAEFEAVPRRAVRSATTPLTEAVGLASRLEKSALFS